jgi:glyoxylase-like metal-dependent hydrolase (beta-lactamase superfamily II)
MNYRPNTISRRSFLARTTASALVFAPWGFPLTAIAQKAGITAAEMRAAGAMAKITALSLRNRVNLVMGSGGNILVTPGIDGQLAIDSGFATSQPQITAALGLISNEPLRHLINTHWHFDHTDGDAWMHAAGANIVAHAKTRLRMMSRSRIPAFDANLPPSPAGALPVLVFTHSHTVDLNGEVIQLKRYTPAHTDTDISVFFEHANVLHTGDTWFNGYYPFIDYDSGGSIRGLITASSENLSLADGDTIVVPGHGGAGRRRDLTEFHEMLTAIYDRVATLKKSGHSLDEVVASRPTARFDPKWGSGFIMPALFTELVYRGA